jgi:hypothetical protein
MRRFWPVLVVLFFAFEAWRFAALLPYLEPMFRYEVAAYRQIVAGPPLVAAISLSAVAVAFFVPMALVVFGLWKLHRRLFRNGTLVNILLTKVNFR